MWSSATIDSRLIYEKLTPTFQAEFEKMSVKHVVMTGVADALQMTSVLGLGSDRP